MGSYIKAIGIANPGNSISQRDIASFMVNAHKLVDGEKSKLEALFRSTGISSRFSVIEDYRNNGVRDFFPAGTKLEPFPSTKIRMELFREKAVDLSLAAINNCLGDEQVSDTISHLITVSCTGMYAPGLDVDLVKKLNLPGSTQRTAINYMGCYAAINALKIANSICLADSGANVLIVCTELCSIHFQKENTEDNYLANSLFGDGSAAVLVSGSRSDNVSLKILDFRSDIFEDSEREMGWTIDDFGFQMKLTSHVPEIIKSKIKKFITHFLSNQNLTIDDVDLFAIHPGGKRILEEIELELEIEKERNNYAHRVLRNYGNMSSPTILFVLKLIMDSLSSKDQNKKILGMAFGPGLTIEAVLFETNYAS